MVKGNELRVSNLVHPVSRGGGIEMPSTGVMIKIVEIRDSSVMAILHDEDITKVLKYTEYGYRKISPIPLTPEILEQCGFNHEIHDDTSYYIQHNIWFCHIGDDWYLSSHTECKPFQYLHQLQNLHFALTNEELIFQYIKELK